MPMKYSGAKKTPVARGKPARKKSAVRSKTASKKVAAKSKADKKKPGVKSKAGKKKLAVKSVTARLTLLKSKRAPKKVAVKTKVLVKKKRAAAKVRKRAPDESQILNPTAFSPSRIGIRSSWQSGDLQGLSAVESADSESVEELLEEGNAFEAAVVMGVEDADNADPEEVRTHQVPEDDVPREYLDSD
jgi:hypothetical protein